MWEPAMITVRAGSTRLSKKCMLPLSATRNVLQHVILRCLEFQLRPIVATTTLDEDDEIWSTATGMNVPCWRGPVEDKMQRWLEAAKENDVEKFVVVDCDDPFFDADMCRYSYNALDTNKADFVWPDMHAYLGSHGMSVRTSGLERACKQKESTDTDNVQAHVPDEGFVKGTLQLEGVFEIEQDLRLTLDYEEDYWLLRTVMRILGPSCTRGDIVALFANNPGLRQINQFRNADWKQHQNR